jgi:hypothetical protein
VKNVKELKKPDGHKIEPNQRRVKLCMREIIPLYEMNLQIQNSEVNNVQNVIVIKRQLQNRV